MLYEAGAKSDVALRKAVEGAETPGGGRDFADLTMRLLAAHMDVAVRLAREIDNLRPARAV